MADVVKIQGIYKHYKGGYYRVLAVGKHCETGEEMVVYQNIVKPELIWIRPMHDFLDVVIVGDDIMNRFTLITDMVIKYDEVYGKLKENRE